MHLTDDDVHALVTEIWESVLQLPVEPGDRPAEASEETLSAFIHIHGTWEGTVVVQASHALADAVACAMFMAEPGELADEEVSDALGEIVNMLGGSVKSMVEGQSSLSLPLVIGGARYTISIPGSHPLNEVWMGCMAEPLMVRIYERASADVPAELAPAS